MTKYVTKLKPITDEEYDRLFAPLYEIMYEGINYAISEAISNGLQI